MEVAARIVTQAATARIVSQAAARKVAVGIADGIATAGVDGGQNQRRISVLPLRSECGWANDQYDSAYLSDDFFQPTSPSYILQNISLPQFATTPSPFRALNAEAFPRNVNYYNLEQDLKHLPPFVGVLDIENQSPFISPCQSPSSAPAGEDSPYHISDLEMVDSELDRTVPPGRARKS